MAGVLLVRRKALNDHPTRSARKIAYRLVSLQALIVVVVAFLWLISGVKDSLSVLLGGVACVLPSVYFARRLFSTTSARAAKKIVRAFYVGELFKLALSAGLVVIITLLVPVSIVPFIVGFVGAQFGFWLAPMFIKLDIDVVESNS